jgi:hypothetical protein
MAQAIRRVNVPLIPIQMAQAIARVDNETVENPAQVRME